MKAVLKNYRQSPQKVREVASIIRGKKVIDAKKKLMFINKKASEVFTKLLNSAVSNAKEKGEKESDLKIQKLLVNEGVTLKRFRPRARGSSSAIKKRSSHIIIELAK